MKRSSRFSPAAQILASSLGGNAPYIESDVLNLCTAAEGIHRRLFPLERRISKDEVRETQDLMRQIAFPGSVGQILGQAMSHLWEPSFPMRIKQLADMLSDVAPEVIGIPGRWKQAVTNARHGNANSLFDTEDRDDTGLQNIVLAHSLRWLLTVVMLVRNDVSMETLRQRLLESRDYEQFKWLSLNWFPRVYPRDNSYSPTP